jgi:hypothetical protein
MTGQAAPSTPNPAPAAPQQQQAQPSVHERLKAFLAPSEPAQPEKAEPKQVAPKVSSEQEGAEAQQTEPAEADEAAVEQEAEQAEAVEGDADTEETPLSTLNELAERTGLEVDDLLDLEVPTKIDGKEGKARLRDLVKSYQLDGHLNQKLASFDTDRKAFQAERQTYEREKAEKFLRMDAGLQTLGKLLEGEFASVDWQKLQAENPLEFNKQYVAYQQRYAAIQDVAAQIAQEQQKAQVDQQAAAKAYLDEQKKLLQAKIPEWADDSKRSKVKADIVDYLKGHGISQDEFESIPDHRHILVIRDALKWHQLQKSKPTALNKVKAAPKLLKPGTQQSRAAQNNVALAKSRDALKQTGKVRDAANVFKRLGIV